LGISNRFFVVKLFDGNEELTSHVVMRVERSLSRHGPPIVFFADTSFFYYCTYIRTPCIMPLSALVLSRFRFFLPEGFFLQECLQPGGAGDYAAALLSQSYAISWLGAAVTTLLCLGIYLLLRRIVHQKIQFAIFSPL